ncbi:large-conductance mechanosensitive channel protein MscL [Botryobacter ruber]|uniref:large-conductance mechanosensitive channel protein MscL n=1 Tax=Botryobacter ruber TaxID=2171629 RepID=UPI000E0A2149|nr:large-conductance mechanosensitive channel protein MscL [Botryobacter ruber]
MGFFTEFREFAVKGNVIDLAVGVVIGTAFGAITTSLVKDLIMPPLGVIISNVDFTKLKLVLKEAEVVNGAVVTEAVTLNYGTFLQTVVNFLIISFAIFLMVRTINRYRRKEAAKPAPPINKQEVLLAEIRDILKEQNGTVPGPSAAPSEV